MARASKADASAAESKQLLLSLLDEAYEHKSWHGPNLRGTIRNVDATIAAWQPQPDRHTIWEIVLHAAYWKYAVRRRLLGEKRGSFDLKGSNWFPPPEPSSPQRWKESVQLLDRVHRSLRDAVLDLDPQELPAVRPGSRFNNAFVIRGAALHDVYHAGQIHWIKRSYGSSHE